MASVTSDLPPAETGGRPDIRHNGQPVPGTVYIVDEQHQLKTKHSARDGDIVLVPAPSEDPDDPLNWSRKRKMLSTFCTTSYVLLEGISTAAIYSVLVPISKDTGLSLDVLNQGTGYMFLLFGWGCLFWQPIALQYGKRPVYLLSLAGTLAIMIWQPHVNTSGQYIATKILQGFFGAPIESLAEISYADIWFQHERGAFFGLYGFTLAGSNFLAPMIMGFINDGQGWQWVFYWCAIFCGIDIVIVFFLMEETNYSRTHGTSMTQVSASTVEKSLEKNHEINEKTELNGESLALKQKNALKDNTITAAVSNNTDSSSIMNASALSSAPATTSLGESKKTYLQKLSLFPSKKQPFRLWKIFPRPFFYFTLPAIVYGGFFYGSTLIWFNVLNATASSFLSAAPYNFSSSLVGLSYVSPLLGTVLAGFYSGNFGDWFVLRQARRNSGVLEAESRLWLVSLSCVITPFALLLWGVGAAHHLHWFALVFAMGVLGVQSSMGVTLAVSYALDSYREIQGEAMVTVILIRNTMSFAVNYAITPWISGLGMQNAFILAAVLGLVCFLTFLPMIRYGKQLRRRSAVRYWRYVEQEQALGLAH